MALFYKRNIKGFTLIELMIVIAIIGILAAVAVPQFTSYKKKGYNAEANTDAKNAYTAARAYFNDYPTGAVDLASLVLYGYKQSSHATLAFGSGLQETLSFTVIGNANGGNGNITYTVDVNGNITH